MKGTIRMNRVASPKVVPQAQLPFVMVTISPTKVSDVNPNGIEVKTNMQPGIADLMVIRLLSEGIQQVTDSIQARKPISANLVMPDGSPAPLPANPENGVSHEASPSV